MVDVQAWTTIFQADDRFYLWDRMDDGVFEIARRDIRGICLVISQSDLRELETVPVPRILAWMDRWDGILRRYAGDTICF